MLTRVMSPRRLASEAAGEICAVRGVPVDPAVPCRIATSALWGPRRVVERRAWATSTRSWTTIPSACARNRSSSAPWLKTVDTPVVRNLSRVVCAHCRGSARRMGPARIDTAAPAKNVPGIAATNSTVGSPTTPTAVDPSPAMRSATFSARAWTSCHGWEIHSPLSVFSTARLVEAPVIAADRAVASSVTSSTGRQERLR